MTGDVAKRAIAKFNRKSFIEFRHLARQARNEPPRGMMTLADQILFAFCGFISEITG